MQAASKPHNEAARLAALRSFNIVDTPPEAAYEEIVRLAAAITGSETALVSLIDDDRQWFKARLNLDAPETPRDLAFCAHAILDKNIFEVEDALLDDRFADNPLVTGPPKIRHYAGAPLITEEGFALGTLCVIDKHPRVLTGEQRHLLKLLANRVIAEFELRRTNVELKRALDDARLAQEKLEQSEERFQHLFQHAHDIIYFTDEKGCFTWFNPTALEITGFTTNELLGKNFIDLIDHQHRHRAKRFYDMQMLRRTPNTYLEFPLITKEGKIVWIGQHVQVIFEEDKLKGFQAVARDITEQVELKRELREAHDNAVESARLKSGFLANVSHELRTPMNGIIGMTNLLLDTALTAEQKDYTQTVKESAYALLTIINDVLDFSRIEADKIEIENIDFDLRDVVEQTAALLESNAFEKGLPLELTIDADVPKFVNGDPVRLRQILNNLVGNAIKFTHRGKVAVHASSERTPDSCLVTFSITDNGIGIPKEKLSHIFEAFTQADVSTTREYGGSGLGLAITKSLIDKLGGDLFVQSTVGEGSVFTFSIPYAVSESAKAAPAPQSFNTQDLDHLKILVAEDNLVNQKVIAGQLKKLGIIPHVVNNGQEALEQLDREPFDVLLMDCQMPVMDGFTASQRIREREQIVSANGNRLHIIALTANAMQGTEEKCLAAGMDAYITKPVNFGTLVSLLKNVQQTPTAVSTPAAHVIDRHTIEELRELSTPEDDVLGELIAIYLGEASSRLEQIVAASAHRDMSALAFAAHTLRGSSAALGAQALASDLDKLEAAARAEDASSLDELTQAVKRSLEAAVAELKTIEV
jgi:PAS domain S-box-containing protein